MIKQPRSRAARADIPFWNSATPLDDRISDLILRLTLEEKCAQLVHAAPAIPRLGVPAYNYWGEALHGVARNGRATVFPQAIGLAATWDVRLLGDIASAIADEARAKFEATVAVHGDTGQYQGLNFWSPNVNIYRDPRWGRGQETYGEDPCLTGELGAAFVRGLQGDDPSRLKAAACAKHFAVHSGPERDRHRFDARVSLRDLRTTYLPAFKKLVVEAKVEAVMGAYNRVLGEPCNASPLLLGRILRGEWGFGGHVVSDCWAIDDLHGGHGIARDGVESAALALKAGCDLECGCLYERLPEAVARGLIAEEDVDRALARVLSTRFRLGLFDSHRQNWKAANKNVICAPEHALLAESAAKRSLVLLKNDGVLPLQDDLRGLFITGPFAADAAVLLGNYFGLSPSLTTALEGITQRAPDAMRVTYRQGCMATQDNANPMNYALHEALTADVIVACMGLSPLLEGEEGEAIASPHMGDRATLDLPAPQERYLRQLCELGRPVILLLFGGGPVTLGDLADRVSAILFAWYPGQSGGRAIARVLFGDESPSGKLPVTFPVRVEDLPPFDDYAMVKRTYRYAEDEPAYPFGFGLGYARFEFSNVRVSTATWSRTGRATVRVTVRNAGPIDAETVVQVYATPSAREPGEPATTLIAFRRIRVAARRRVTLAFDTAQSVLSGVTDTGEAEWKARRWTIEVGECSPGRRGEALGSAAPVKLDIESV